MFCRRPSEPPFSWFSQQQQQETATHRIVNMPSQGRANAAAATELATAAAEAASAKNYRGTGYSRTEDLLMSRAFIAASEDPIVGNAMKGTKFMAKMHSAYVVLLSEQEKFEASRLASLAGNEVSGTPPEFYSRRKPESIYDRFKGTISPRVMKFLGIKKTLPRESGWNDENYYHACKESYELRYPKMGKVDDLRACVDYLSETSKCTRFTTFYDQIVKPAEEKQTTAKEGKEGEGDTKDPPKRPPGQKASKQKASDKEVVKAVLTEMNNISNGGDNNNNNNKIQNDDFYGKAGKAIDCLVLHMQQQNEMKMFDMLSTPQKRSLQAVHFDTMMLQANAKKAAAAAAFGSVVNGANVPGSINSRSSNGESVASSLDSSSHSE
jgi:hypothetical protein